MLENVNWVETGLIFVIVLIIGMIALSRILMEKTIGDASNAENSRLFVGPASAMAVDLHAGLVTYTKVFPQRAISIKPEDIAVEGRLEYELKDTTPRGFLVPMIHSALNGNHQLSISTNLYDLPEISIAFSNRQEAQRCLISLREFISRSPQQGEKDTTREALIKALEKRIHSKGQSGKPIDQRERDEHICHLLENMEKICGRPWKHGDNTLIVDAMFHFFGCEDDDLSCVGFKYSTLKAAATECKKSIFKKQP